MRRAGLAARIERGPYTPDHGYAQRANCSPEETKPTAIFSSASPLTVGVLRALKDLGAGVPGDVSLVAFEDPEWYAAQNRVDVLRSPLREMALLAVELISKRLAEPAEAERAPTTLRFSGRLIVRDRRRRRQADAVTIDVSYRARIRARTRRAYFARKAKIVCMPLRLSAASRWKPMPFLNAAS